MEKLRVLQGLREHVQKPHFWPKYYTIIFTVFMFNKKSYKKYIFNFYSFG